MLHKTCQVIASFIILAALIFSSTDSSAQQIRLDVSLSDTTYYVCQSIWLDVELTNISEDTLRIFGFEFPGGHLLNIVLTNESGDTVRPVLNIEFLDWPGFILNPEETYYEAFDLADIFHNFTKLPSFQWTVSLAPGRYEVTAEYFFRQNIINTPKITFVVIEPTGAELDAFELYVEAYENQRQKDYSLSKQQLNRLTTDYPKSVYAERAYVRLSRKDELLEKYPDSGYLHGYLRTAVNKMSTEEKQRFLEKVIKEHPKTRSAKIAEQLLRGL